MKKYDYVKIMQFRIISGKNQTDEKIEGQFRPETNFFGIHT
jgi:hypothetical protein